MQKPSKEAVINKLRELVAEDVDKDSEGFVYKTKEEKAYASLRQRDEEKKESCYCIEGLLCEAAIQLGFPGRWDVHDIRQKDSFVELTSSGKKIRDNLHYIPSSVCEFLGVPNTVDFYAQEKSLVSFLELEQRHFPSPRGGHTYPKASKQELTITPQSPTVALWKINDNTPASLKQMMEFIIKLIKEQPEPETNEANP